MSEIRGYNPENTEYGTRHDGEVLFPDYFKSALEKQITETLRAIEKEQQVLFTDSVFKGYEKDYMTRAYGLYVQMLEDHTSSLNGELTELGQQIYLKDIAEKIASEMDDLRRMLEIQASERR